MKRVSVIMPVYNKESVLNRSIQSVLEQTYRDFELIVVNDGSNDRSEEVIFELKKSDPRIIYIKQENKGVSAARNKGIENANFEYISFLDADDEIKNSFLEKMIEGIANGDTCYCGHYDVLGDEKIFSKLDFGKGDILEAYLLNRSTPNTNSWLIKKEFLDKFNIRFTEGISWGEDMEFFSKVLLHDENVNFTEEFLNYYHRDQEGSLSQNSLDKIEKDVLWMDRVMEYVKDNETNVYRKTKIIQAIKSYRLPAAIVYRIDMNINEINKSELKATLKLFDNYLKEIKISNGLRSIKLYYYNLRLYLRLR